jgi:hypothetical protein
MSNPWYAFVFTDWKKGIKCSKQIKALKEEYGK